jgi:hypothetical protein
MTQSPSGEQLTLALLLQSNQNSQIYKAVIAQTAKAIEERTFWYFTSDDAEFLGNVYNRKIDG